MLAAMLVSSGNFLFGNLAVREIGPVTLAFWRNAVALACTVPFVVRGRPDLAGYFRRRKLELLVLSGLGSVLTAWFMYLGLRADDLINLSFGYTLIPLMAVLFSALLLGERLSSIQYLGLGVAFLGALVFAFHGDLELLLSFQPHEAFLWMVAVCATRSLYLVLLKRWDVHPAPGEGLFVLLAIGTALLLPGLVADEIASDAALDYPWPVWGSIAFRHRHGCLVSAPDQLRHRSDRRHPGVAVHLHGAAVRHGRIDGVPRQPTAGLPGHRRDLRCGRGLPRVVVPRARAAPERGPPLRPRRGATQPPGKRSSRSAQIAWAALRPGAMLMPEPGRLPAPHN
jgi:drug/metabolite transporter (DMT)-like permease